jgi:hypothetical protein
MLRETAKRRIRYRYEMVQGKPVDCLIRRAAGSDGSHRPGFAATERSTGPLAHAG